MKKLVMVINGKGGVGKDALCQALEQTYKVVNVSAITPIKEIAAQHGWQGEKTPQARRFLAELKRVFVDYNDLPTQYLVEQYEAFAESDAHILCVHIREPEEIAKFVRATGGKAKTLLIRGGDRMKKAVYGNASDDCVEDYDYDYYFLNDKGLDDAERDFCAFLRSVIEKNV